MPRQISVRQAGTYRTVQTPGPYGDCPFSSLLCRTLWKSYLLSCRTKLAKLLCLKCLGRIDFVNFSFYQSVSMQDIRPAEYRTHFQNNKAIAFITPAHHLSICRVLQHPNRPYQLQFNLTIMGDVCMFRGGRTCTACEPRFAISIIQRIQLLTIMGTRGYLQSRSNYWPPQCLLPKVHPSWTSTQTVTACTRFISYPNRNDDEHPSQVQ